MNTLLHFLLLLCQSCRSLRNVASRGRIFSLINSAYHGWLSMMTSSEGPFLVLPRAPNAFLYWLREIFYRVELNQSRGSFRCSVAEFRETFSRVELIESRWNFRCFAAELRETFYRVELIESRWNIFFYVFAVVNCPGVVLSVFYSSGFTRCQIFLQL